MKKRRDRAEARAGANGGGAGVGKDAEPLAHGDAVRAINAELEKQDKGNYAIGELVDRAIGPSGRAGYGERVIGELAEDAELMCSAEHLRRCLHYFRLMRRHGDALKRDFTALKFGHLFQLSRLLRLEDEFGDEAVTKAVVAMAKHAMDNGKDGKPVPADALERAVSTQLRSVKGRGLKDEDPAEDAGDENQPADTAKTLDDAHAALSDSIGVAQEAAAKVASSGRYEHACALQADVDRIAQAHFDILRHIVGHDPQSVAIPAARRRIRELARLVGLDVIQAAEGKAVTE